jgi:hypothetical protein
LPLAAHARLPFDPLRLARVGRGGDRPAFSRPRAAPAEAIRGHWGIENRLHYVLDTALGEDAIRIRKNPGVFAHLRHFALNLHCPIFSQTNPNIKTCRDPREILQSNRWPHRGIVDWNVGLSGGAKEPRPTLLLSGNEPLAISYLVDREQESGAVKA